MPSDDDAAPTILQPRASRHTSPEERERHLAWRRGEAAHRARGQGKPVPCTPVGAARQPPGLIRFFAALADNVRDYAIFLVNTEGLITYWGEGARVIKWWSKDEAEGAHLRLLYPAGGSEDGTAEEHLGQAAARGEYTGEGTRVRNDGSTFWAGVTLTALRDDAGVLLGYAKVMRDLTARRAGEVLLQSAAEASESARRAAVAANAAKSGFLATMSHEIRTPINAVIGYLELLNLEIEGPLNPAQLRHVGRASASARHLLTLVTEVLDFSRIEADRVTLASTTVRVGDAVAGALAILTPEARARGVQLTDAVSGFAAGLSVVGDEARLRQIVINLLGNAVKFTAPHGDEPGRIVVSAGTASAPSGDARVVGPGPWVYIRVEDTGSGIPADRIEAIFEPFVQADMSLTRAQGGTGLGLAISRRLARLMGGDITARSEVGVGSTFFLWLTAAPAESHATAVAGEAPVTRAPELDRPGAANVRDGAQAARPLLAVANALLGEIERVLHGYAARLRSDPATPTARTSTDAQLEDHFASFLADMAATMQSMDPQGEEPVGEPAASLRDGSAIQRVVADRHGAQRARLGWSEQEVRREFTILREEIVAAVRRRGLAHVNGSSPENRRAEIERALEILTEFVAVAERLSLDAYRRATSG